MNVGSLFSGAGLMDWGLTLAGFEHAWFCERDPYCRRVLERRWPGVPVYEDVREVDGRADRVDLLAGGFPCQPFSSAGQRRGLEDDRWLWPEFARVISELRPSYVFVENVPGLLTRGGGMGRVLGDLAEMRYDAEWDSLRASDFGAPHRRERVWIVAYPSSPDRHETQFDTVGASAGSATESRECSGTQTVQDSDRRSVFTRRLRWGTPQTGGSEWWAVEPDVGRVADGVPDRLDRLAAIGNGVVPQIARWIGERILEREAMSV